jgi:hypothetical protein
VPDIASKVNVLRLEETALYFCERRNVMAFWNWKKKRTTAKPKINASVPKPKINIEKQESNVPPQPKKTDISKPDKVPKNEDVRKEFLKTFHQLTYRYRSWDVWRDFIIMFACSLSNPVDKSHYEEREKRYLKIIKKIQ